MHMPQHARTTISWNRIGDEPLATSSPVTARPRCCREKPLYRPFGSFAPAAFVGDCCFFLEFLRAPLSTYRVSSGIGQERKE